MSATINDVAKAAGVSTATVSHIINKTRFVSPILREKVEKAIVETGYIAKLSLKENTVIPEKKPIVALVVPGARSTVYSCLISKLSKAVSEQGRILAVYVTNDDSQLESDVLHGLTMNKRLLGLIISPTSDNSSDYEILNHWGIPYICLDRTFTNDSVPSVSSENTNGIYISTEHLIKSGHTEIGIIVESKHQKCMSDRLDGYFNALNDNAIPRNDKLIFDFDLHQNDSMFDSAFHRYNDEMMPTAIIACGNKLTYMLVNAMRNLGLSCPKNLSIIGFGDENWCSFTKPAMTSLCQDTDELVNQSLKKLEERINGVNKKERVNVPMQLIIRESTAMVPRGPFGETGVLPDKLTFTNEERRKIRECGFKVGISFMNKGIAWTRLVEAGMRDAFDNCGISIVAITNAHFDPLLQVTQLDSIKMQHPDAVVVIPQDSDIVGKKIKEIHKTESVVLIGGIAKGITDSDYSCYVSTCENENGANVAKMMGEYYKDREISAGFIIQGIEHSGTAMRDGCAIQTIREQYKNIHIADEAAYITNDRIAYIVTDMLRRHGEIETLYVTYHEAAIEVANILRELRREDITIFTCDLDYEIGRLFANGRIIKGISAQKPYDIGVAAAKSVAKALLGDRTLKYVAVLPRIVRREEILAAWKEILHEPAPMEIERAMEDKNEGIFYVG